MLTLEWLEWYEYFADRTQYLHVDKILMSITGSFKGWTKVFLLEFAFNSKCFILWCALVNSISDHNEKDYSQNNHGNPIKTLTSWNHIDLAPSKEISENSFLLLDSSLLYILKCTSACPGSTWKTLHNDMECDLLLKPGWPFVFFPKWHF